MFQRFAFLKADFLVGQKGFKVLACENSHQVVFDGEEEHGGAGVALTA